MYLLSPFVVHDTHILIDVLPSESKNMQTGLKGTGSLFLEFLLGISLGEDSDCEG